MNVRSIINEMNKEGLIEIVKSDEEDDFYRITDGGILKVESALAQNPDYCIFLLSIPYNSGSVEEFYLIIERIAEIRKAYTKRQK